MVNKHLFFSGRNSLSIRKALKEIFNNRFQKYENYKRTLTNEYGYPMTSSADWLNYKYKNQPQSWDLAIRVGRMGTGFDFLAL